MLIQTKTGVELCYDTFGDPSGRPLILIIGLATQMISWPEPFFKTPVDLQFFKNATIEGGTIVWLNGLCRLLRFEKTFSTNHLEQEL